MLTVSFGLACYCKQILLVYS